MKSPDDIKADQAATTIPQNIFDDVRAIIDEGVQLCETLPEFAECYPDIYVRAKRESGALQEIERRILARREASTARPLSHEEIFKAVSQSPDGVYFKRKYPRALAAAKDFGILLDIFIDQDWGFKCLAKERITNGEIVSRVAIKFRSKPKSFKKIAKDKPKLYQFLKARHLYRACLNALGLKTQRAAIASHPAATKTAHVPSITIESLERAAQGLTAKEFRRRCPQLWDQASRLKLLKPLRECMNWKPRKDRVKVSTEELLALARQVDSFSQLARFGPHVCNAVRNRRLADGTLLRQHLETEVFAKQRAVKTQPAVVQNVVQTVVQNVAPDITPSAAPRDAATAAIRPQDVAGPAAQDPVASAAHAPDVTISLRVDPAFFESFKSAAHEECRSVDGQIVFLMRDFARRR